MKRILTVIPALALVAGLAACGDTRGQRVATGALGGAVAGQVLTGEPLAGAAIGGIYGAVR